MNDDIMWRSFISLVWPGTKELTDDVNEKQQPEKSDVVLYDLINLLQKSEKSQDPAEYGDSLEEDSTFNSNKFNVRWVKIKSGGEAVTTTSTELPPPTEENSTKKNEIGCNGYSRCVPNAMKKKINYEDYHRLSWSEQFLGLDYRLQFMVTTGLTIAFATMIIGVTISVVYIISACCCYPKSEVAPRNLKNAKIHIIDVDRFSTESLPTYVEACGAAQKNAAIN